MENNIYKIVALAAFLALLSVAIYVYRPQQNKLTRITVVGDSQTKIAPDTSVITFSVVTQGKQALLAQQENSRKSEAVKNAVEAVVANAKAEIKTSDYSLSPERDYYTGKMPKIVGYEVKNTVTVRIDTLDHVGALIDAATSAGANSVEGIQFVVGESSPAQGEALALATKQAMAKADAIARSLNGRVVRVVETAEGGIPIGASRDYDASTNANASMRSPAKPYVPTPVQAGSLNVRSTILLVVEIET